MELIGRQFGHIRVTEVVGQGGMGDVYAGYDEKLERKVAVKVLNADQRLDGEARERLLREARALSRLDHPNICRIHDYIESEEVDLLVLEYIDGRTLYDAVDEKLPRGEQLRIAMAVAEVLVAAHRAGIVHRDLKPENVMLTKTGEVKVLDFGLARWLNRRTRVSDRQHAVRLHSRDGVAVGDTLVLPASLDDSMGSSPSGRREFLSTAVGITLGTPLYMSPEQARGDSLTPASDMFAFGLLLQTLFTGMEPHPAGLTAREVILRVARGETQPVQGVPRDVAALINRLKQFAPADRPTGIETVERLRFLAEKPQRIVRRSAVAAIVLLLAGGAWRYTVDLKTERAIALAERANAVKARAQAEDLVEFMLGDLRKKLDKVGRLEILDDVGARALVYVESLDPSKMSADELARNAKALNQLGEVRIGQGKTAEALDLFGRSLRLADAALERAPRNPQALLVHGATHFWIGHGLRTQGKTDQALQHMRAYMKDGDALAALDGKNKEYQLERAYGHSGVAGVLEAQGKYSEALEHLNTSLRVKSDLAMAEPANFEAQAEVARAHNKVGSVLYRLGDISGARRNAEREVAIYRDLHARDPKDAQAKRRVATSLAYLARVLNDTGNRDRAQALWEEELSLERELAALDPANVAWRRSVAMTSVRLAPGYARRGDRAGALKHCVEARQILRELAASTPASLSIRLDQAVADIAYARLLASGGEAARARELFRAAADDMQNVQEQERTARLYHAIAALELGDIAPDPGAAAAQWQRAESALAPIASTNADPLHAEVWTRILLRRGRVADARRTLTHLRTIGYDTTELEARCRESGC